MSTLPTFDRSKTIKLSVIFEMSLYALVALSSIMLTISEGIAQGPPPQGFTLPLLFLAFLIVDHWRAWSLPWWAAGLLGLVGLGAAFWEVPQYLRFENGLPVLPEERRLDLIFAGAHLLVFLTWIVLFLEKTNQQYWWLWGLALLQIAVGASQSTESVYGILLIGYLFLAVWTLSVFSLLQGQQQFDRAQQVAESMEDHIEERAPLHSPDFGDGGLWRRSSRAIGTVQRDSTASWINLRFLGGVVGTAFVAFLLAMLFFFLVPRHPAIWKRGQTISSSESKGGSTVGFSRKLALGDIGQILESRKKVMEVRLTDFQTGDALDIEQYAANLGFEEPLFKGMTTIRYEQGRWETGDSGDRTGAIDRFLPRLDLPRADFVKQEIRLEPIDAQLLFAMPPAIYGAMEDSDEPITMDRFGDILKRPESAQGEGEPSYYSVLSPKVLETRGMIPVSRIQARYIRFRLRNYKEVPPDLEKLRALAREKADLAETPPPDDLVIARRLESYLKDSGEFQYTLNANILDKTIDPLEDFLFNRKMGHCEYFASALALMLRSVDVPSRLVSGFKGGNYNQRTGVFEVEERHAHAWVEAYINGNWVILDPTPASRAESVASVGAAPAHWLEFRTMMRDFWTRFVVNLNGGEQRRLLEPFKRLIRDLSAWGRNGRGRFSQFVKGLKEQLRSPERWISWQGGLVTFVLLTFLSAAIWLVRAFWRLFKALQSRYFDPQGQTRTVAFYERFRRICAAAGLSRKASQTPREFAVDVGNQFRGRLPAADWDSFPLSLIEAYYDVRYGGRQLSPETIESLDQQLTRFESLLARPAEP